jgi:hypothetical protein
VAILHRGLKPPTTGITKPAMRVWRVLEPLVSTNGGRFRRHWHQTTVARINTTDLWEEKITPSRLPHLEIKMGEEKIEVRAFLRRRDAPAERLYKPWIITCYGQRTPVSSLPQYGREAASHSLLHRSGKPSRCFTSLCSVRAGKSVKARRHCIIAP